MTNECKIKEMDLGDLYVPSEKAGIRTVVTPRVIALFSDYFFPMVNLGGGLASLEEKLKKPKPGAEVTYFQLERLPP